MGICPEKSQGRRPSRQRRCWLRSSSAPGPSSGRTEQYGARRPASMSAPEPSRAVWGAPAASFPNRPEFPFSADYYYSWSGRYEYEPCHGVCALLQADRRLPGTPRCAGSILTSCSCCESSSWSPSRRTAGLSPERRLLCARANRECATKRGARTAAIEPAGVLAVSSDAKALRCCVLKQKPVVVTTISFKENSMVC